jgi:metal-responsive CopG/Arc/MetJ family transcriptional regulator
MGSKKPISIRIEEEELKELEELSKKEGINRSALISKAIKQFIQSYDKKTPELSETLDRLYELESELERKYETLLTRVNILTGQVDNLVEKERH